MVSKAKLDAKRRLVDDMQVEVRLRQATWTRTGNRTDLYLYKSAKEVLDKAEKRYQRYLRKCEKFERRSKK